MGCRCYDIPRCAEDIENLRSVLSRLDKTADAYEEWTYDRECARQNEESAFELTCEIKNAIQLLLFRRRDVAQEDLRTLRLRVSREIDALESELSAMRREDRDYHAAVAAATTDGKGGK